MSARDFKIRRVVFWRLVLLCVVLGLAGCATKTYVVLLPDDDGSIGQVLVNGREGKTTLAVRNQAVGINGEAGKTFIASQEKMDKDVGSARAASPLKPMTFFLYFEMGESSVMPVSLAEIPKIRAEIARRASADLSIIGHADTVGDNETNNVLGMARARAVADLLGSAEVDAERMIVGSAGELNLVVPTPDNVSLAKNRCVEVIVR